MDLRSTNTISFVALLEVGNHKRLNSYGPEFKIGFMCPFILNDDAEVTVDIVFNEPGLLPPAQPIVKTLIDLSEAVAEVATAVEAAFLN